MEEFIFASHTSIISKQLLIEKLVEEGVIEESKPKKKKNFMFGLLMKVILLIEFGMLTKQAKLSLFQRSAMKTQMSD